MGQKTHPYGFRLGYNNTWRSRWYADGKNYANLLHEDLQLRQELMERLENAAVSAIESLLKGELHVMSLQEYHK